jgi:hypothetical protein
MKKPKLYISGAISGMPGLNRLKFAKATKTFRDKGFIVVNPHEVCEGISADEWSLCMRLCITSLMGCDVMIMLDDWQNSKGATIEHQLAQNLGIKTYPISTYLQEIEA